MNIKNVLLAIVAVVFLNSCEKQSTTTPDTTVAVVASDPPLPQESFRVVLEKDKVKLNENKTNY